jgi:hypothetical protein
MAIIRSHILGSDDGGREGNPAEGVPGRGTCCKPARQATERPEDRHVTPTDDAYHYLAWKDGR